MPNERYYRPGQFLFREGEPSQCMYLVKKGSIGIRKRKGGAQIEIAKIYSNEVIGELSFFDRQPRSASAVALTEVEVLEIKFDQLDKIYKGVPDYLKTIMASVADRLRKANEMIRRLQKETVNPAGESSEGDHSEEPSAADILAATAGISSDAATDEPPPSGDAEKKDGAEEPKPTPDGTG
jgi:CRP/FNR family transcriptional regulator, cyclic AMP receptor protein